MVGKHYASLIAVVLAYGLTGCMTASRSPEVPLPPAQLSLAPTIEPMTTSSSIPTAGPLDPEAFPPEPGASSTVPVDLPVVPIYPRATALVEASITPMDHEDDATLITFEAFDDPDKVHAWYERTLLAQGWRFRLKGGNPVEYEYVYVVQGGPVIGLVLTLKPISPDGTLVQLRRARNAIF